MTGAAAGIGRATCDVLVAQGWTVIGLDRERIDAPRAIQVDVGDASAFAEALRALGPVDGLVNNAAIQLFKPLEEIRLGDWDRVAAVNLRAAFIAVQTLLPTLVARGGAVVNVASVHGRGTSPAAAAYAASKGGLLAFTRAAAVELAPRGVRVNAVVPGAVDTEALRAGLWRRLDAEATLVERTPLGRIGRPQEIGEAIAFLLDGERSGFVTGQELVVDGGALAQLSTE